MERQAVGEVVRLTQEQFRRSNAWRRAAVGKDELTRAACLAAAMKVAGLTQEGDPASRLPVLGGLEQSRKVWG